MRSRLATVTTLATTLAATLLLAGCSGQMNSNSIASTLTPQNSNVTKFVAHLSGANEVPPVKTDGNGIAWFNITEDKNGNKQINYRLSVSNIKNVIMAHLHIGTPKENGMHVAWLYPTNVDKPIEIKGYLAGLLAQGTITKNDLVEGMKGQSLENLITDMRQGKVYVQVHTKQNPEGEIRGQLQPANK